MTEPQSGWTTNEPAPRPEVHWQAPPEAEGPAPGVEFAGYGARLVAYILDGLILSALFLVAFFVLGAAAVATGDFTDPQAPQVDPLAASLFGLMVLVFIVVSIAYFPFFWARGGQTPGMRPFGIRVVRDRDGGRVSAGSAILRLIGLYVGAIPVYLGYIWIFIDKRRRGWHDLIGGTVVIKDPVRR
jgi:uncharacterized RDD family membrane protein YckC